MRWHESPCPRCGSVAYDDGRWPSPYCSYSCRDEAAKERQTARLFAEAASADVICIAEDAAMLWPRIVHKGIHQ